MSYKQSQPQEATTTTTTTAAAAETTTTTETEVSMDMEETVVVASSADEQDEVDLESGSLPVIQLPATDDESTASSSVHEASAAAAAVATTTSTNTRSQSASTATATATVSTTMHTIGRVEAPASDGGIFTLEDLEGAPIAHLVKEDTFSANIHGSHDEDRSVGTWTETHEQNQSFFERRAEFISASLIKPTAETPLGFDLTSNKNAEISISSIEAGSLISRTPFRVGDRLLSVNNKRCYVMKVGDIVKFIASLTGDVTIVVHHVGGDPNLVESMITKPSLEHRCGLGLASAEYQHLKIANIDADGLFFQTLLNVGDHVISINGMQCAFSGAPAAGEMISEAGKYITIKARTLMETGVVVAALSSNNSTGSFISPGIANLADENRLRLQTPSSEHIVILVILAIALIGALLSATFLR